MGALICTNCRFTYMNKTDHNDNQTDECCTDADHVDKNYSPTEISLLDLSSEDSSQKIQLSNIKKILSWNRSRSRRRFKKFPNAVDSERAQERLKRDHIVKNYLEYCGENDLTERYKQFTLKINYYKN